MHDPWPSCPIFLQEAVRPYCEKLGLYTLPEHIHEVLFFFLLYHSINVYFAPTISRKFFAKKYDAFNKRTRVNWDVHIVSLFQSTFISAYAFYAMYADEERKTMDRVWGYTGFEGTVQAFGAGYFLWDLMVSIQYVNIFGIGLLAHAVSALTVFSLGFRPFVNYYGPDFLLYELSSPFLNFHWFMDKLNMTGSTLQLINGICLLVVFFGCRLIWGNYSSLRVGRDVYLAWQYPPEKMVEEGKQIPTWLVMAYLGSNITLNSLNFYWFSRMIITLRKRFEKPAAEQREQRARRKSSVSIKAESLQMLIEQNLIDVSTIDGEDDTVLVQGSEVEVPLEIVELVEKTTGSVRKRKA